MANRWIFISFLLVATVRAREIRSSLPDLDEIDAELKRSDSSSGPIEFEGRQIQLLTVTITSASTVTQTIQLSEVCAKTVNVTGACRRRRARWLEEPIVMTFDDNMDVVDQLLIPRTVQVVEVTAEPAVDVHARTKEWPAVESVVKPSMEETGRRQSSKTFGLGQNIISQLGSIINRFRGTRTRTTSSTSTSTQIDTPIVTQSQATTTLTSTLTSILTSTLLATPQTADPLLLPSIIHNQTNLFAITGPDTTPESSLSVLDATVILNTLDLPSIQFGDVGALDSSQDFNNIYQTLQATVILPTLQATIIIPTLQATAIRIETTYMFVTTTRTFFIQKCTPSPFPFPLCTAR